MHSLHSPSSPKSIPTAPQGSGHSTDAGMEAEKVVDELGVKLKLKYFRKHRSNQSKTLQLDFRVP